MTRQFAPGDPLLIRATATDVTAAQLSRGERASVPFGPGDVVAADPTSAAEVRAILPQIQWFDDAYARANKTSNPEDWLDAACSGQQLRNAVIEFLGPRLLGQQGGEHGWQLVPVEPTEAMYTSGYDATRQPDGWPQFADTGFCLGHAGNIYRAMLAAAPPATDPSPVQAGSAAPADGAARLAAVQAERDQAVAEVERLGEIVDRLAEQKKRCERMAIMCFQECDDCALIADARAAIASSTSVGAGEAPDA